MNEKNRELLGFDISMISDAKQIKLFEPKSKDDLPNFGNFDSVCMEVEEGYEIPVPGSYHGHNSFFLVKTKSNEAWSFFKKTVTKKEDDGREMFVFESFSEDELREDASFLPKSLGFIYPLLAKTKLTPGVTISIWWDEGDILEDPDKQ